MRHSAFTLIEILVSLSMLSFFILGFAALETDALKLTKHSSISAQANNQLSNAQESIVMSSFHQASWQAENAKEFPKGSSSVERKDQEVMLNLCWFPSHCHTLMVPQ